MTAAQLAGLSDAQLGLLRNEIYARHGYQFIGASARSAFLRDYFSRKPWYHPDTSDSAVVQQRLSRVEKHNVDTIVNLEKQRQGGSVALPPAGSSASSSRPHVTVHKTASSIRKHHTSPSQSAGTASSPNINDEEAYARIKAALQKDYPDSYITQKMLFDENVKAYQYMKTVPDDDVKARLEQDYPDSYITQKMLYDDNEKAKRALGE